MSAVSESSIVVDASAVLALLLDSGAVGHAVADHFVGAQVIAPQILPFEVWNVLRKHRSWGLRDDAAIDRLRATFVELSIELWPTSVLEPRIWAHVHNLSTYDAAYVALAEVAGTPLLTCDARLARAPGIECPVALVVRD